MKINPNLINNLKRNALTSAIEQRLSATLITSGKKLDEPCCNSPRNTCRGLSCGSLHAEARAIVNYFGSSLSWNKGKGWYLLRAKHKKDRPGGYKNK